MATLEVSVVLKRPHAKQDLFISAPHKRKIIRAGRRGGKTTGVSILAVQQFLAGRRVLYAAPVSEQIAKFWTEVKRALAECIEVGAFTKNETEHRIEKPGSTQCIRAKTAWNADTLRGDYADLLILDEWQLMNESAWEEVGAPMLLDNNGDAVFIYTPPSLHSRSVTKARDLRHASKMFEKGLADTTGRWLALHFTSHDNPHISTVALEEITQDMTALAYRQEIEAEDIDEIPGALWTRKLIEQTRVTEHPPLVRIVVGVDPSGSSTTEAGIVAGGVDAKGHGYVLRDATLLAPTPQAWAGAAVTVYDLLDADRIVGERNYGGDMVESTIKTVSDRVSYKDVIATRGKLVRAEPIAALYEKGIVHHVGQFPELEDEQVSYVPGNKSPNRMDALVWCMTELMLHPVTMGVVEALKEEAATLQKVEQSRMVKPVVVRDTVSCPMCQAVCVARVAGHLRCAQCGHEWGFNVRVGEPQGGRVWMAK
ncbi:MAG TPA: hypothetical protein VJV74_02340 [Terriglobia bacterium]|nr:hypothetical protein [Terriglobia bacterium]